MGLRLGLGRGSGVGARVPSSPKTRSLRPPVRSQFLYDVMTSRLLSICASSRLLKGPLSYSPALVLTACRSDEMKFSAHACFAWGEGWGRGLG